MEVDLMYQKKIMNKNQIKSSLVTLCFTLIFGQLFYFSLEYNMIKDNITIGVVLSYGIFMSYMIYSLFKSIFDSKSKTPKN